MQSNFLAGQALAELADKAFHALSAVDGNQLQFDDGFGIVGRPMKKTGSLRRTSPQRRIPRQAM
jgi:hypothetical protein